MNAYQIGVSIVLANGVSPVLAIIGSDLLKLHTSTGQINQNFAGWSTALLGVGAILTGATILGAMTKIVEKSADFQDAMTKVSQLNPKVAELVKSGEIQRMSFKIGSDLGMKVEDVTKVYGGIYGVLQDPEEAEKITPMAARYARLMQARHPGSHPEDSINTLMRAGELSGRLTDEHGRIDPKKVQDWFDMAARLEAATHGQVNPEQLLGLAQQGGGVALRSLSQEGYEHMAIMAQMMGGQRAGTALLSLRSQMTGTMMKRSAEAMQEYGLLKEGEWTHAGGHVEMTDEAAHRMLSLVNKDPMAFVEELLKRLEAKGIHGSDDQMLALQRILGRQTTQRMVADMLLAREQIKRETAGLEQGATVDQGLAGYDKNIHAAQQNMSTAWHNLMIAIGGSQGERFATFLNKIADGIKWVTDKVNGLDPKTIDTIFQVTAGLAAGLVTIGAVLLVALGTVTIGALVGSATLIGGAVAAVVAAAATFAAFHWDDIKAAFNGIYGAITGFIDKLVALYHSIGGWFSSAPNHNPRVGGGPRGDAKSDGAAPPSPAWSPPAGMVLGTEVAPGGITPGGVPPTTQAAPSGTPSYNPRSGYHPNLRPGIQLQSWNPGIERNKPSQISLSLQIDGRTLAQAISDELEALLGFPTGAPSPDGVGRWFDGDHNTVTT
ncbi:hypothetical protein HAP48_0042405 [Bradyrhizobium septentrionale]|uniref:Uncharacterized protein n=1 Tax=Bradyrhizobium septentrionale TaxID=1404411 RepID=A0A974A2V3_9BRAD|nr:hypothetical protein [Bradyrhizobium septentrionale]UGY15111.1 hypothetical protein HAP48_0042405 [Bradyrhizobium septentrionale]